MTYQLQKNLMLRIRFDSVNDVQAVLDAYTPDLNEPLPYEISISEQTYLIFAAARSLETEREDIIRLLLERGADPNGTDRYGKQAIHYLAESGDIPAMKRLLSYGAALEAIAASDGGTPLLYAASANKPEVVEFLLEAGANNKAQDGDGTDALDTFTGHANEKARAMVLNNIIPPEITVDKSLTREKLLEKNEEGVCPLDAGIFWMKVEQWLEQLEENGSYLSRNDVLSAGKNSKQFAVRAFEFYGGYGLCKHLADHGYAFGSKDLVTEEGTPTALLQAAIDNKQVGALFTTEAWVQHGADEMRRVYQALPESAKEAIEDYQVLYLQLRDASPARAAGRAR